MKTDIHYLQQPFVTVSAIFTPSLSVDDLLQKSTDEILVAMQHACGKKYTFKAEAELQLQVGDFVIVHAHQELKIVQITAVHPQPQIDEQATFSYKWVIDKIDLSSYKKRIAEETRLEQLLLQLDFAEKQHQLMQRLSVASQTDMDMARLWQQFKTTNPWLQQLVNKIGDEINKG